MQFYEKALTSYNNFTTNDPKRKNYFEIGATLLLLIVLILMIYPAINHIVKLNQEISSGKVVDSALKQKIQNLNAAKANLNEIRSDLPLLEQALPTGSNLKNYLQKPLENLTSRNNLNLKAVNFSDVPISEPSNSAQLQVRQISYEITLTGNFVDFSNFIRDLEGFIRTTEVDKIDIKKPDTSNPTTYVVGATTRYLGSPVIIVPNQKPGG